MRLIDADAFKAEMRELYRNAGWDLREVHYSQLDLECNIDMMPTVEAVPLEDYRSMEQTVNKLTQALAESTMGQLNPQEPINYHIENDGTYAAGEEEPDGR